MKANNAFSQLLKTISKNMEIRNQKKNSYYVVNNVICLIFVQNSLLYPYFLQFLVDSLSVKNCSVTVKTVYSG